jgi:hypothetical protein
MTVPTHVAIIFSVCPLGIREASHVENTYMPVPGSPR